MTKENITIQENKTEVKKKTSASKRNERISSGINLVTFGLIALLVNFEFTTWSKLFTLFITYWPLFIVAAGIKIVLRSFSFGAVLSIVFDILLSIGILVAVTSPVFGTITEKVQNSQQELYGPEQKNVKLENSAEFIEYEINIGATAYSLKDDSDINALFADSKNGPVTLVSNYDNDKQHQKVEFYNDSKGTYLINPFTTGDRFYKLNTNDSVKASYILRTGATDGTIEISNTEVSSFEISLGAGSANITFSERSSPKNMDINLGGGEITLNIPKSMSIDLDYTLGAGNISINDESFGGLAGDSSYLYEGTGEEKIQVTVQIGAGNISINSY